MAVVKYSGLVTDMKGKIGGSVMAGGSGGATMRQNKYGNSKQSANFQRQKARVSSVSQAWRQLTDTQRNAWNAVTTEFPTTNKWGEPRFPSGYELFQRLNITRLAVNEQLLIAPPAPPSFPALLSTSWTTPNEYLFSPQRAYYFSFESNIAAYNGLVSGSLTFDSKVTDYFTMSIGLDLSKLMVSNLIVGQQYKLIDFNGNSDDYVGEFGIIRQINDRIFFYIKASYDDGTPRDYTWVQSAPYDNLLDGAFNLAITVNASTSSVIVICAINGELISGSVVENSWNGLMGDLNNFVWLNNLSSNIGDIGLSYLTLSSIFSTSNAVRLMSRGYIYTGTEFAWDFSQLSFITGNQIVGGATCNLNTATGLWDRNAVRILSLVNYNTVTLSTLFDDNFNGLVRVFAASQSSQGRADKGLRYREIFQDYYVLGSSFDISAELFDNWGIFSSGQDLKLKVMLTDPLSGVSSIYYLASAPNRNPRFKAGSELSGKVNK